MSLSKGVLWTGSKELPVDDPKIRQPDMTKAKNILKWECSRKKSRRDYIVTRDVRQKKTADSKYGTEKRER